jgi:hypothetical protein
MTTPEVIQSSLQEFHGSETYHPCLNRNFVMSEGVKYLTEAAECDWLIDLLPGYMGRFGKQFTTVDLRKTNKLWRLTLTDPDGKVRVSESVDYCTFPLPEITLYVDWFEGFHKWIVFLPAEL